MSIRNALRKAANLVVQLPDEDTLELNTPARSAPSAPTPAPAPVQTKTVEQIVAESAGPNLDEIAVSSDHLVTPAPGGNVDFQQVYKHARLVESRFTAEQAMEMIAALPADLPIDVKRKTVSVTMAAMGKATGVDVSAVVADAASKLAAVNSYSDSLQQQTADYLAKTQLEIAQLETSIAEKRREIEQSKAMLEKAQAACRGETDKLDDVLEFFSMDVAPSKLAGN